MQADIEGDDRLWTRNASPVACFFFFFFQNKVMSLLKILLIFDERRLSGQPPLSGDSAGTPRVAA